MTSLFKSQAAPTIAAPAPMPTPVNNDEVAKQEKRRAAAISLSQSGRASTILTDYNNSSSDKLGG